MGWLEPAIFFSNFGRRIFGTFRVEANVIMRGRVVPYRLSSDPKVPDLRCHFTLKFVFIVGLVRFFCLAFENNYVERYSHVSATEMFAMDSSFWQYKVYSDMLRFSREEASIESGCYSCRLACVRCHVGLLKNATRKV